MNRLESVSQVFFLTDEEKKDVNDEHEMDVVFF